MAVSRPLLEWSEGAAGPVLAAADDDLSWRDAARCAEVDPEIFFPPKGGSTREPKFICRRCEVRQACLDYALENDIRWGIWGGLSENQRRRLRQERAA